MKFLILGSQGFIGSHLCDHFLQKNNEVIGCDIINAGSVDYPYYRLSVTSPDLENIFSEHQFDVCINAAGAANVYHSVLYPESDFESNVLSVAKILDTIRKHQPQCKYIHISSAAVYGNPETLPVKESAALDPISPYGYHKLMSEIICREYHQLFQIPVTVIRPFSIFGNGLRKQLLWDMCSKLKQNDSITLFGTGEETRDFIHISDFVVLVETLISKSKFTGEVFNAGSGLQTRISDIALIFQKKYPGNKTIAFNGESKPGDPMNWEADISAIKEAGFSPGADLENAVKEYINWFNQAHED